MMFTAIKILGAFFVIVGVVALYAIISFNILGVDKIVQTLFASLYAFMTVAGVLMFLTRRPQ